ncbi:glycosyltransferase family 2 protein [Microbacterium sp. RU33B]|uniref:glycosyltransferase family 2 protein n=1 Tax=Microbacterium sp. RU33B TaxID=1907390 RepID=UPI00095E0D86|nr:glycosyltransferase family 2 protein [Microbacterium sp. RU33B]SIT84235.1 Glycosyltransferase, GT2 family [Microbacterium sp. RU33B]
MNDRALSVVIATRNRPDFLRDAVRAVSAQEGVGRIEIIVVHDQSEVDPSVAEVAPEADVRVVPNVHAVGLAGARNTGIELAEGEFVAFCDDDDVWMPGKARAQVGELRRRPESDLVATGIVVEYDGESHPRYLPTDTILLSDLVRDRHTELHPSTFLFRTSALRDLGMVSTAVPGGFGEDYELLLRTARRAPIANIPRPFVSIRWHQSSFFFERWSTMASGLEYLLDQYEEFQDDPKGLARIQGQIAFARASEGRRRDAVALSFATLRSSMTELRAPLALLVVARVAKPEWIMVQLHRFGRGI